MDLFGHGQRGLTDTAIISADPFLQFGGAQPLLRFRYGALAMPPLRLNGIEPRALHWQPMDHNPYSVPGQLDLTIMTTEPVPDGLAVMPGGVIPEPYQGRGALSPEPHATPSQKGRGDSADRASRHKPQPQLLDTRPATAQQPITGQG